MGSLCCLHYPMDISLSLSSSDTSFALLRYATNKPTYNLFTPKTTSKPDLSYAKQTHTSGGHYI